MNVSILLADDHRLFALGIKKMLEDIPSYNLVAHVENGKEAIQYLEKHDDIDMLILDLNMPVMDGMQLLPYLNRKHPGLKKLVISGHHNKTTLDICKSLGANGFLGKDACFEEFTDTIQAVANGEEYFQPVSSRNNIGNGHHDCLYQKMRVTFKLSERETEILQMILNQIETKEIAEKLGLSALTVKTHRKNIFRKLNIHNLSGLLSLIREHPGL